MSRRSAPAGPESLHDERVARVGISGGCRLPFARLRQCRSAAARDSQPLRGRSRGPRPPESRRSAGASYRHPPRHIHHIGEPKVTILATPPVLDLFCYSAACRQRRDWVLMLKSAPVYRCAGGCGTTREVRALGRPFPDYISFAKTRRRTSCSFDGPERRSVRYTRRSTAFASAPFCGCCGLECAMVHGEPALRCACDPFVDPCPFCNRGVCHCRCGQGVRTNSNTSRGLR